MAEADIAYVATAGAAGLAMAVSAWALLMRGRLNAAADDAERERVEALASLGRHDAMLRAFDDVSLALTPDGQAAGAPIGSAELVARLAEDSDDVGAAVLARLRQTHGALIDALVQSGQAFEGLTALDAVEPWRIEGRVAGGAAWLRLSPASRFTLTGADATESGLAMLGDASPTPTWVVDGAGKLAWANRAWLNAINAETLDAAVESGLSFDRGADALVAEAARLGVRQEGFRWTTGGGARRAWRIIAEPAGGGAVTAFAIDVTEAEETRDTLRRHVEAHDETLNHLADAVAIFGPQKRLAFHNTAFQTLFDIDPAWLDERPTHAELLDRLRQRRSLPEVVDYAGWKAHELDFYGASEASPDDSWSLPDGRTLRVVRQPHPLGGILLIFSDITDELKLRSRFNAQIQVQRATLDKLNDAVAVFGSDGRLRLHNEAFETFWSLSAERIATLADFDALAELCKAVLPDPALWLGLKARVADPDPESPGGHFGRGAHRGRPRRRLADPPPAGRRDPGRLFPTSPLGARL